MKWASWSPAGWGGFQPLRVLAVIAIAASLAFAIDLVFVHANFFAGILLVCGLAACVPATRRAIALWRGTESHDVITHAPVVTGMSLGGVQAFTPCAVICCDGMVLVIAALVVTGGEGTVGPLVATAGFAIATLFLLLGFCAAAFRRPRMVLPKTMRQELSS